MYNPAAGLLLAPFFLEDGIPVAEQLHGYEEVGENGGRRCVVKEL